MAMIEFRKIDKGNVDAIIALELRHDQEHLVASNAKSLAQALFHQDVAWYRAIYQDDQPVGFVMLSLEPSKPPYLWRLMIDRKHQGRGYGRQAVQKLMSQLAQQGHRQMTVSCVPGDESPIGFYADLAFKATGERDDDGEVKMSLDLPHSA